jgi:hypothetical protein
LALIALSCLVFALCSAIYTEKDARANGRFPKAQVILAAPGSDAKILYMRTTFGLLKSVDGGKSFRWICERALGFTGQWDPPIAMTKDGRLFIGLEDGIASSADGCTFEREPGLEGETVKDLTVDGTGTVVWAITGVLGKPGRVWRRDASATSTGAWAKVGPDYPDINFLTIDIAPSNPKRIYMTGEAWTTYRGEVWRSDDGGKTFVEQKNELEASGPFFLSYVDPKDANHIVLRHLHMKGSDVLASNDGGKTLRLVVHWTTGMYGFAKSEDGKTLWIGSGDPKDGIWRSTDRGEHFEPMIKEGTLCLFALGGTLYSCANPYALGGYALGISHDGGKTLEKVSGFADVEGAMLCDAGAQLCAPGWPPLRGFILTGDAGPDPDASAPGDGGDVEASSTSDAAAGSGDAGTSKPRASACGCTLIGSGTGTFTFTGCDSPWSILLLAGLVPLGVWARARKRLDRSGSNTGASESI